MPIVLPAIGSLAGAAARVAGAAGRAIAYVPRLLVGGIPRAAVPQSTWALVRGSIKRVATSKTATVAGVAAALYPLVNWTLSLFSNGNVVKTEDSERLAVALGERVPGAAWSNSPQPLAGEIRAYVGSDPAKQLLVLDAMKDAGFGFALGDGDDEVISALQTPAVADALSDFFFASDVARMIGDTPGGRLISQKDQEWLDKLERFCSRTGFRPRDVQELQQLIASGRDEHWNHVFEREAKSRRLSIRPY